MNRFLRELKELNDHNTLIITPYHIEERILKKASVFTPEVLLAKLFSLNDKMFFDNYRASFSDPILSCALSSFSLNVSHDFVGLNYDEDFLHSFMLENGVPPLYLLNENEDDAIELFLQLFNRMSVYVVGFDRYHYLFQQFILSLSKLTTVNYFPYYDVNILGTIEQRKTCTIVASSLICDQLELSCLNTSTDFIRVQPQELRNTNSYQTLILLSDFYLFPSVQSALLLINNILGLEHGYTKDNLIAFACYFIDLFVSNNSKHDLDLPQSLCFIYDMAKITRNKKDAFLNYLVYFTPFFDELPSSRKQLLKNYLLNNKTIALPDVFNGYEKIELISELDVFWKFRKEVFLIKNSNINSYPVLATKQKFINIGINNE